MIQGQLQQLETHALRETHARRIEKVAQSSSSCVPARLRVHLGRLLERGSDGLGRLEVDPNPRAQVRPHGHGKLGVHRLVAVVAKSLVKEVELRAVDCHVWGAPRARGETGKSRHAHRAGGLRATAGCKLTLRQSGEGR